MTNLSIETAENGWIVSWWCDEVEDNLRRLFLDWGTLVEWVSDQIGDPWALEFGDAAEEEE